MQQRTNKQRQQRKGRKQQVSWTHVSDDHPSTIVNISKHLIVPPRMLIKLGYNGNLLMTSASTGTFKQYYPNGCYDVDPSVGNVTLQGYNQWMAFYGAARVVHFKASITAANNESFPVRHSSAFFPKTVSAYSLNMWKNQYAKEHRTLGAELGMGVCKYVHQMSLSELQGTAAYEGDLQQYYATIATNPLSLLSFCIGIQTMTGDVLTNGVAFALDFEFTIELSLPEQLTAI